MGKTKSKSQNKEANAYPETRANVETFVRDYAATLTKSNAEPADDEDQAPMAKKLKRVHPMVEYTAEQMKQEGERLVLSGRGDMESGMNNWRVMAEEFDEYTGVWEEELIKWNEATGDKKRAAQQMEENAAYARTNRTEAAKEEKVVKEAMKVVMKG